MSPASIHTSRARRLHSLTGVVPLAVFFAVHLLACASLLRGEASFRAITESMQRIPAVAVLEVVFIVLPLVWHAGYGVMIAVRERQTRSVYPTRSIATMQRITGAVALLFILIHLRATSFEKWVHGAAPSSFQTMLEAHLSSTAAGVPWIAIAYMIGIASACFHFSAGLWSFSVAWNLSETARARRRVAWTSGAVGVLLFGVGAATVVQLATGTRILESPDPLPDGPDRPACGAPP